MDDQQNSQSTPAGAGSFRTLIRNARARARQRWRDLAEHLTIQLSWRMPRRLVYWCFIRVAVHASSTGTYASQPIGDITLAEASREWRR